METHIHFSKYTYFKFFWETFTQYNYCPLGRAATICGRILLNSPRLFDERLETVRHTQNHWRLIVLMDPQKLQEHFHFEEMQLDIQKIYKRCPNRSSSSNCKNIPKLDRLNKKLCQLKTICEFLTRILMKLHQDLPNEIIPRRTMHEWREPLLGPVTWVTFDDVK